MNTSVHDVLDAINEARGALEREPSYQRCIDELNAALSKAQSHNQELELKLISRNQTIDALESKVRSLEVERDDASFRALESDDKLISLLKALGDIRHDLNTAIDNASPKQKTQEPPSLNEMKDAVQGTQSEPFIHNQYPVPDVQPTHPIEATGQSEADPTSIVQSGDHSVGQTSVTSSVLSDATSDKPYAGKKYSEISKTGLWPSYTEWFGNGGDWEGYNS